MPGRNKFGLLSKEYDTARRGYPGEVYEYLHTLVPMSEPYTLDIGCGTGISTRELKEHGFAVVGADKEAPMIDAAKARSAGIEYSVAVVEELPFEYSQFDVVTSFTAFHWFNNEVATMEIWRVLKNGGLFFAALKRTREGGETEEFKNKYQDILRKYAGENFDSTKNHYNHEYLNKAGFTEYVGKSFPIDEKYTVEESLSLMRSQSVWNVVPEAEKPAFMDELRALYENHLEDGFVVRRREITTFGCYKRA